jgi:N-acylneuraminate cytidylyltransferase
MNILAIIPARGGSKGIPLKNIQPVGGLPLIAWNIKASLNSRYITRTIVSTDDAAIAQVSKKYGAEVIWRPDAISGDTASSESALIHALQAIQKKENHQPDITVFLQCTSPLTSSSDIDQCIEKLITENADTATTVTDFHYFLWKEIEDSNAEGINHDKRFRPRRQDREPQYIETGAVYVMRTDGFLTHQHRFFGKTVLSHMPTERVQEIDEPSDLIVADFRLRALQQNKDLQFLPQTIQAVVFDFDGVMTDNKVHVDQNGVESVVCHRGDGMGIGLLKRVDIRVAVMSTETNPVVSARCKKLGIECYQSLGHSKEETLKIWCAENNISMDTVIYMGNDINDIECMKMAGCSVVPADTHPKTLPFAQIILQQKGGEGAVRELCDFIITKLNNK